ncbi:MAG: copper homeostasis protein CutC [Sarcina sp.]
MSLIEVCVGNYNEAIIASKKGADRIELCDNLMEGGTTPSYGTIKKVLADVSTKVMVIIRPRGGNFIYSSEEIEIMKIDIINAKNLGAYGIVIGLLTENNKIDEIAMNELLSVAKGLSITFHMAFDEVADKEEAIEILINFGVDRILTKGGQGNAYDSMEKLKEFNEFASNRIVIMPGKGITTENRDEILEKTGVTEIHGTKIL